MSEFSIAEVRWLKLDINKVVTKGNWVEHPDLSKVDEVGFADLLPGSGHGPGGWSDVASVEVYGKPVKREAANELAPAASSKERRAAISACPAVRRDRARSARFP